jgi:hypothetical protein
MPEYTASEAASRLYVMDGTLIFGDGLTFKEARATLRAE